MLFPCRALKALAFTADACYFLVAPESALLSLQMDRGSVNVEKSFGNGASAEGGEEDSDADTDSSSHEDSEPSVVHDLGNENATASVGKEGSEGGKTDKSRQCELTDSTSEWESEDEMEDSDTKAGTGKGGNLVAPGEVDSGTAHEDKDTEGFDEAVGSSQADALKLGSKLTNCLIIEEGKETSRTSLVKC
jgi:hypothetical protein